MADVDDRATRPSGAEGETEKQRIDRNLIELLNELRVVLPGVQVLFAFLLAVPFQNGWDRVTPAQRDIYFVTLCFALIATALLLAPTAYHRLNFRARRRRELVEVANQLAIWGIAALAISLVGAMVLIADLLFNTAAAVVFGTLTFALLTLLWLVLPRLHDFGEDLGFGDED
ncbi:MAG TPA: DUF6328 family protein [Conexibacter sp.]|jgi:cation transport ATPase